MHYLNSREKGEDIFMVGCKLDECDEFNSLADRTNKKCINQTDFFRGFISFDLKVEC